VFHADGGREPAEEQPVRLEEAPAPFKHRPELSLVTREMQYGTADDDVRAAVREAARLDGLGPEIRGGEPGSEPSGESPHGINGGRVRVDGADVVALAEKENEVASLAAPRVENPHPRSDPFPEDLIEEVDIDQPEEREEIDHQSERIVSGTTGARPPWSRGIVIRWVLMKSKTRAPQPKKKTASKLKTQANDASVAAFLDEIADEGRRKDALAVLALMKKVTKTEPKMWGGSIVGFGDRHYQYASGRAIDWFLMGFSPRKAALTLYFMSGLEPLSARLKDLGKHKTGKGCLYIQSLEDVDKSTLTVLIQDSFAHLDRTR
jgi:hypothetical protein